ncbi:hypothetical protein OPQ81_011371 [Rhizoctonia solani]|nr:hypothetical protein OPQ81_011371 [Rhizoctonia solani]
MLIEPRPLICPGSGSNQNRGLCRLFSLVLPSVGLRLEWISLLRIARFSGCSNRLALFLSTVLTSPCDRTPKMPLNGFAPSHPRNESHKPRVSQPQPSSRYQSGSPSSQNSITRRNSAPLLGAIAANEQKPVRARPTVDTRLTYQRPGMSPINKPVTPIGRLSTFGTPYNSSWETSRTESIPRPSTAPLPDDDDDLVGGVHYTTYGSRNSQVYEAPFSDISVPIPQELLAQAENEITRSEKEKVRGHRRSGSALLRMVGVEPATPEVGHKEHNRPRKLTLNSIIHPSSNSISHQASQNSFAHTVNSGSGTESTRGTTSADDTTLISMSRFPMPPDSGTPRTPGTIMGTPTTATMATPTIAGTPTPIAGASSNGSGAPTTNSTPRPNTPGSMITIHPNTPSTPAVPEFLAASRTTPEELSARSTPNNSRPSTANGTDNDAPRPRLRTRSSLLALAVSAAAMVGVDVDGHGNGSTAPKPDRPIETPKTTFEFSFPLPEHMKANSPPAHSQREATSATSQAEPTKPEPQYQAQPRSNPSDPSNPRRRSLLERLTSRITTPVPDTTIEDVTWNTISSNWTDAEDTRQFRPGPVLDFDLAPEEPLIDMEQFGLVDSAWSPIRQSATFPLMASTPKTAFPTSQSMPLSPTREGARSPTNTDPLLPREPLSPTQPRTRTLSKLSMTGRKNLTLGSRPSARSTFSNASRRSRRRAHGRGMSGDSIPTRMREGGRLESLTRRTSADALSAEGTMEGTVLYGVGEEMLRLMFGAGAASSSEESEEKDQLLPRQTQTPHGHITSSQNLMLEKEERERERTRSLPRPRADLVSSPTEADKKADLGSLSYPTVMPLNIRPKGHRRGTASKENASLDKIRVSLDQKARASLDYKVRPSLEYKVRPSLEYKSRPFKSRSRSKSVPLAVSQQRKSDIEVVGILTNGNNSGRTTPNHTVGRGAGRVVIVNSTTVPNGMGTPTRKTRRSSPLPPGDTETSQPGVIVTAPTPPAPQRSLSMPLEALPIAEGNEPGPESPRGTVSRGTSVQFVPESFEGRRRGGRSRKESANVLTPPVPEVNENGKGKRKVEREPTDASDTSAKKPRLSVEDMDITFMGEPLFDGKPQHRRGGLGSQASSHPSTYSRHSQSYSRHSQSYSRHSQAYYPSPNPYPSPTSSPDPERTSIPMHAIFTPRVQSLYGTGAKPDYVSHRQSISSIPRPKSRASARSNATGARSHRSNATGARSNVTGARSNKTSGSQRGPKRWRDKLPMQGWCFLVGFLVPFVWWYAAFARAERGYYGGGVWSREVESQWEGVRTDVHRDDGRIDAHTWRFRCRLMAAVSIVVYIPVIVLAAVFA